MREVRRAAGGGVWSAHLIAVVAGLLLVVAHSFAVAQSSANQLRMPSALAYDAAGNLYIADAAGNQVLEATLGGTLVVIAGTGSQGFSGDGAPAAQAELNVPQGLAFGPDGTLYIADTGNSRIRAVSGDVITTFAGTGTPGYSGDGGVAAAAEFRSPTALAVDSTGALVVCDTTDHRIRRISGGVVSTFAGNGVQGFAGDGGAATLAELDSPTGVAVAADGRVFIADTHNNRVRVVAVNGTISTFAGNGQRGFFGDGGAASAAELSGPRGLAVAPDGTLLIADADDQRVRSVSAAGVISTISGNGTEGTSADGANAVQAALHAPRVVAISPFGQPVFGDTLNGAVRVLTAAETLYQPAAFAGNRASVVQASFSPTQVYGQVGGALTVTGAVGVPQGTVTLSESGALLATGSLSNGAASVILPLLSAGTHSVTATYAGDGLNPSASANAAALTVTPLEVTARADSASAVYGSALPPLTGTLAGVLAQDSGQVSAVFSASTPSPPPAGTYTIAATLTGPRSSNYALSMSSTSGSLSITPAGSATTLGSIAQSYVGLPVRLTANVVSTTTGQPTGSVQFLDGSTVVATAPLVNGSASAVYVSPPAGTSNISAQYGGDVNFTPSTSAAEQATISALPDFALSASGGGTATVAAGNTAAYTVQVSSQSSPFTGVVVMSAQGLPPGATATFSPVQVVPGASTAAVTVSIQTPASQASLRPSDRRSRGVVWVAFACLCGMASGRKRRRLLWLLGASLCICGCGARTVGEGSGGVTSQSYTVQITGTSTNLVGAVVSHSTAVTLVIQQ